MNRKLIFAGVILLAAVFAALSQTRAPATDASYGVVRIEPLGSASARTFRHSLQTRRATTQHNTPEDTFEVDMRSGLFVLRQTDLFIRDSMPLCLTRTYRPWDTQIRAMGMGTSHPYELTEYGSRFPYTYMDLVLEDYETVHFDRISKGTGFADAVYEHTATASEFYGARIAWNGDGWTVTLRDGRVLLLPEAYNAKTPTQGAVVEMRNARGQRIKFDRDPGTRNLRHLTSPGGRAITFQYNRAGQVSSVTDDQGNGADYYYDSEKRLYAVSRTDGRAYRFAYDHDKITTISDEKSGILLEIDYNEFDRVQEMRAGDGSTYRFRYVWDQKGTRLEQASVTVPDGTVYTFDHGTLVPQR